MMIRKRSNLLSDLARLLVRVSPLPFGIIIGIGESSSCARSFVGNSSIDSFRSLGHGRFFHKILPQTAILGAQVYFHSQTGFHKASIVFFIKERAFLSIVVPPIIHTRPRDWSRVIFLHHWETQISFSSTLLSYFILGTIN
jgi:hypothetical protein